MGYVKQTWANDLAGGTPLDAERLEHIEDGIDAAHVLADGAAQDAADALAVANGAKIAFQDEGGTLLTYRPVVNLVGAGVSVADDAGSGRINITVPGNIQTWPFFTAGPLVVKVGRHRIYNDTGVALTILGVRATCGVAPTGASVIVDVNKNGTTIFTTQANRPAVAAAGATSGKVTNMNVVALANGDYVTVDVDQIGSTLPGEDLVVQVLVGP
jgi:hypothetical protein